MTVANAVRRTGTSPTLTIATFNVRWGLRVDGDELDLLASVAALDADVVALQEVWTAPHEPSPLDRVANELGYAVVDAPLTDLAVRETRGFADRRGAGVGCWGLAVLSRVPIGDTMRIPLGRAPGDPVPRTGLRVDLALDGRSLALVNVHLSHRLYAAPTQLSRLARHLAHGVDEWIVAGDFNCTGVLASVVLARLRRAVHGGTWPARRPFVQVDHLFVSRSARVVRGSVLQDLGSDHRPLRAALEFPSPNAPVL